MSYLREPILCLLSGERVIRYFSRTIESLNPKETIPFKDLPMLLFPPEDWNQHMYEIVPKSMIKATVWLHDGPHYFIYDTAGYGEVNGPNTYRHLQVLLEEQVLRRIK